MYFSAANCQVFMCKQGFRNELLFLMCQCQHGSFSRSVTVQGVASWEDVTMHADLKKNRMSYRDGILTVTKINKCDAALRDQNLALACLLLVLALLHLFEQGNLWRDQSSIISLGVEVSSMKWFTIIHIYVSETSMANLLIRVLVMRR
ncbi:hypothetical protein VNO77_01591 [Canavalia gladiata]|uniref:Uncharacterized protein n=1 Tax=Canavalia gladiata TaxID=3824 RepID=A0AAN9R6F5_CANGL